MEMVRAHVANACRTMAEENVAIAANTERNAKAH